MLLIFLLFSLSRTIRTSVRSHHDTSWFPCTYVLYPKQQRNNQNRTVCDNRNADTDRDHFLLDFKARADRFNGQQNTWVAKATSGAKG